MALLFVYGTLKRGCRLHAHLDTGVYRGAARTEPGYALYRLGWYPGMVAEASPAEVTGELYEIGEELLPLLDDVEGVPDLYQRVSIPVLCPEHSTGPIEALTYLYQPPVRHLPRIECGHWTDEELPG